MNWSYQGTKACTVLVDNSDSKSILSETNKTLSSSSTFSSSKSKQQSSASGGMSSMIDRIVDPFLHRKRRGTFNQHDTHKAVVPSDVEVTSTKFGLQSRKLIGLHDSGLGMVKHVSPYMRNFSKFDGDSKPRTISTEGKALESESITPSGSSIFMNESENSSSNSDHNNFPATIFTFPFPSDSYSDSSQDHTSMVPLEVEATSSTISRHEIKVSDSSLSIHFLEKESREEMLNLKAKQKLLKDNSYNSQDNSRFAEDHSLNLIEHIIDEMESSTKSLDLSFNAKETTDNPTYATEDVTFTETSIKDWEIQHISESNTEEYSSTNNEGLQEQTIQNTSKIFSSVRKETHDLKWIQHSTEKSSDSPKVPQELSQKSEEMHQDYPQPVDNIGQSEVEIMKLNADTTTKCKLQKSEKITLTNDVKMTKEYAVLSAKRQKEFNVITKENNDEDFLREFKRRFHTASEEDPSLEQEVISQPSKNIMLETFHPPKTSSSDSTISNQIQVSLPGNHVTSSSSRRVLVNITIATEDEPGAASYIKPLYVFSVSIPTNEDPNHLIPDININTDHVPAQSLMTNTTPRFVDRDQVSLPPPPKPPATPTPIWAGGECECSCPCMDVIDESDNFSAVTVTEQEPEVEYGEQLGMKTTLEPSTFSEYLSTKDQTTDKYSEVESTNWSACPGTTPLPPEPTILILEGKVPFIVDPNPLELTLSFTVLFYPVLRTNVALKLFFRDKVSFLLLHCNRCEYSYDS